MLSVKKHPCQFKWSSSGQQAGTNNLEILVHQKAINYAQEKTSSQVVVVSGFSSEASEVSCISCCDGYCKNIPELCLNIEEADTRIIPHALHAVDNGIKRLVVLSTDTMCLYFALLLGCFVPKGSL